MTPWYPMLAVLIASLACAYLRTGLRTWTIAGFVALFAAGWLAGSGWLAQAVTAAVFAALTVPLNLPDFRRQKITAPLLKVYQKITPQLSDTERVALEAGTVGFEGELFSGKPDWKQLLKQPAPQLTTEEQAFLDGPCEELCHMINDWEITHERADLPPEMWEFLKKNKFFGMIIPKEYGGLQFSPLALSMILAKLSSRSAVASSTVGVPNSLGPAELLLHYGTDEQKQYWLPRLANGDEIPCFALTSSRVGSDATALVDNGTVCKGTWQGREVVGIRLNWDKRYITLAPVATVMGLAFKLYDPEHLLGDVESYGITAALIPTDLPGIEIGRRHFPIDIPFQNGPIRGRDVFVPLDAIIGGTKMAGQGWHMLVQQLAVGRSVVLPSNALGGAQAALYATGAYAKLRRQFNLPIGKFHGVGEAIARMAGSVYIMMAASRVTCTAITNGEKPAVPSAILKYHNTELGRQVAGDAMDVHGGKGIMLGPKNYLARGYEGVPIAITVEGANILTRNLIIFGQGAIRCHPFVRAEMDAARDPDVEGGLVTFDRLLFKHVGYALSNAARSLVMAVTLARFTDVPVGGPTRRYYQHVNRYSASFALITDAAMLTLGGELKRRELLSARLGDILSYLYLASMVLKHYQDQGEPAEDLPLVEWSCRTLLYKTQEQFHGLLRNFPSRWLAALLRFFIFPRGRTYSAPADELGQQIVELMINPTPTRERLAAGIYKAVEPGNQIGLLQQALEIAEQVKPLERRVFDARRNGEIKAEDTPSQIDEAERKGILTQAEADAVRAFDRRMLDVTGVDDFDPDELRRQGA